MEKTTNRSRRDFIARLTALGVAGLVAGRAGVADDSAVSTGGRLRELCPEDFAKHVGQTFIVHAGGRRLEAELTSVERRPRDNGPGMRQPFSVRFRLPGDEAVPHQIYPVEHALMGRLDLFLGAVGKPSSSSAQLEAVFA